jgi:uncharacterized protein YjbI with pentapeptide repeats
VERNAIFIERQDVTGADYSRQTFDKFGTLGATLTGCRFDRAYLKHCAFGSGTEQSHFVDCSFDGSYLRALGGFTRFVGCTFRNLRVTQTSPDYLEFVDCTFTGRITGLRLWGAPLSPVDRYMSLTTSLARQGRPQPPHLEQLMVRDRNEIRGNDFSTARLIKVEFRFGVDLTAQRLPAGACRRTSPWPSPSSPASRERPDRSRPGRPRGPGSPPARGCGRRGGSAGS